MGLEGTTHLISAVYRVNGWNLYKRTVNQSGKVVSAAYKQQAVEGNKAITRMKGFTTQTIKGKQVIKPFYNETHKAAKAVKQMGSNMSKTTGKSNDLMKALKRAAVVAPIWLALRAAMMAVIQTIKEGARYWMDFDKAMQKTQQVIHGFTGDTSEVIDGLTDKIRNLSISTGQSMAKLAATFYRFGTVGLNFETSMQGMIASTKLANVMFGDNEQIARVLAQTYRLLGESMDSAIPVSKRMEVISSQIYKLWKTNAFEINEFTGALERFLPTANMFNFEITDSLALLASLHTAGVKGTRAGRLLGSSMQKLVSNMGDVAQTLGVDVNPNLDNTFDMLMKTLGAVKKLNEAGGKIPDIENLTVFGGVRQRRAPMALVALYDTLLENLKSINVESGQYSELLADIDSKNKDILDSVHKQVEIFGNLRKMAGEAFVQGIVGGENFKESLKELNSVMQTGVIPSLKTIGQLLYWIIKPLDVLGTGIGMAETAVADLILLLTGNFKSTTFGISKDFEKSIIQLRTMQGVAKALKGEFDTPLVLGIISNVKKFQKELELSDEQLSRLVSHLEKAAEKGKFGLSIEGLKRDFAETDKVANDFLQRVKSIQDEIKAGNITGGTVGVFDPKTGNKLYVYANKLKNVGKETLNSNIKINSVIQEKLNLLEREVTYAELLSQGYLKSEISMSKLTDYISEQVKIHNATQGVIDGRINAIKTETVLSAVLDKNYKEVLNIFSNAILPQERLLEIEKRRLEVVKARIKEEGKGIELSTQDIKLYRIAQKYGADPAKRISEFLQGKMDYQAFQYRDAFKIFEKEFGSRAEQEEAKKYYKRGEGRGIGIETEALRIPDFVKKQRLRAPEEQIQIPQVPIIPPKVDVNAIIENIEIKLPDGILDRVVDEAGAEVIGKLKTDEKLIKFLAKTLRPYV